MSGTDSPVLSTFGHIEEDDMPQWEDEMGDDTEEEEDSESPRTATPLSMDGEEDEEEDEKISSQSVVKQDERVLLPKSSEIGRVVVDYLIMEGYREAAETLCEEAGLDLQKGEAENLDARVAIRQAIVDGRMEEAIQKIRILCPNLYEENPEVRFHLQQQNLIEMIRNSETEKALEYAQGELASASDLTPEQLDRLEKTFALLAFEKPEESPFGKILDPSQRQMVSTEVNAAVLHALKKPVAPRMEALLRMMVWAQQQLMARRQEGRVPDSLATATSLFGQSTSV